MMTRKPRQALLAGILILIVTACAGQAAAQSWSQVGPGPKGGHSAVININSDRMIVFGGFSIWSGRLNDVWLLTHPDGVGGPQSWRRLVPGNSTPVRSGHSAVYDPASNRMIVFGGDVNPSVDRTGTCFNYCSNDVWVLTHADGNGGTSSWTQLTPSGLAPSARESHSAVYDSANNRMIVFGGRGSFHAGMSNDDVWVLSHANGLGGTPAWTQLHPAGSSPAGRSGQSAIYNDTSNRMVVFGGSHCIAYACSDLNDAWVLSNANGDGTPYWTQLSPTGTPPVQRFEHTAVYDPATNRMVVFGGSRSHMLIQFDGVLNDVWVLSHADGTGGSPVWTESTPSGIVPNRRSRHTAVYNAANNCMIVYGGLTKDVDGSGTRLSLDDTAVLCDASD
jgi:hypothetical protein